MTQVNSSITVLDQENELVNPSMIREMTIDFSKQIDELDKAIQLTKDAGALATRVQDKGFLSMFGGVFSGSNTKDLAESVKILGASVETTQKVIEVILKVNNTKNQFLRSFHTALTDKILSLNREMEVTYGNQKNAKQATITIATQLRAQIEEKIKHAEMIDEHEVEISKLQEFAQTKDFVDDEQSNAILELKEKAVTKDELDYQQTQEIDTLKEIASHKEKLDNQQSTDIQKLKEYFSKLHSLYEKQSNEICLLTENDIQKNQYLEKQSQEINGLTKNIETLQESVELANCNFNKYVAECNSVSYKIRAAVLPMVSMSIVSVALYFAMK